MPLNGDGADDTRYVHLLGHVGVHLAVVCPDCKRELNLMAQISSTQCGQDKDEAQSLSESEEIVFPQRKPDLLDTFDLECRLSDDSAALATKRVQRRALQGKRKEERIAEQEKQRAEAIKKEEEFEKDFFDSFHNSKNNTEEPKRNQPENQRMRRQPYDRPNCKV